MTAPDLLGCPIQGCAPGERRTNSKLLTSHLTGLILQVKSSNLIFFFFYLKKSNSSWKKKPKKQQNRRGIWEDLWQPGQFVTERGLRPTKPKSVQSGLFSTSHYCLFIGSCIPDRPDFQGKGSTRLFLHRKISWFSSCEHSSFIRRKTSGFPPLAFHLL